MSLAPVRPDALLAVGDLQDIPAANFKLIGKVCHGRGLPGVIGA